MSTKGRKKLIIRDGKRFSGYGEITGTFMTYLKRKAKQANREFNLSSEYLWNLYLKQGRKCVLTGIPLNISTTINNQNNLDRSNMSASLDRIDCSKDYIEGNVQWIHKIINRMRGNLSVNDFIEWCRLVNDHANSEPSSSKDQCVDEKVQRLENEEVNQ